MPKVSQKSPSLSLTKDNSKSGKKLQEKFDLGHLQNTNIHDAVELSIAASEALAISELVKSGPPSEAFPAAAILEMALRVKEARNRYHMDELEDDPAGKDDDIDDADRLSDLDENTMADAFEDVGLPVTRVAASPDDFCGLQTSSSPKYHTCSYSSSTKHEHGSYTNSSHVLNTDLLGSHYESDGEVKNRERGSQDVDFIDAFAMELRLKELPQEYAEMRRTEPYGDGPIGSSTKNIESHLNGGSHQPVQTTKDALATTASPKEDGMIAEGLNDDVGVTLFHSQESMVPSPCIVDSWKADVENAVNDVVRLTTEQFRSRWFGGWTGKDAVTVHRGRNNIKSIPKFLITETSFLSESVDVVTDENSVQKPDTGPEVLSLTSTPLVAIPRNTNEGTLLSQDVMGSSNFSMADPLCSVVPCSISLDNDHTMQASGQKDLEKEAGKCLNLITEHVGLETIPLMPFCHGEENVAPKMSGGGLVATTRKQLSSLKLYSMVENACYTSPEGEFVYINESVPLVGPTMTYRQLPSERNVDCFMSLNKEDSAVQLRSEPIGMKVPDSVSYRNTDAVQKEQVHRNTGEMANGVEVQVHRHKERSSPLVLNYGTRRRLKACNIIVSDTEDESSKRTSIPCKRKTRLDDSRTDVTCMDQTKATSVSLRQLSLRSYPHEKQNAANKKVRFAEAEVEHWLRNTVEEASSGYQTRSRAGTGKRVKASGLGSMFGIGKANHHCLKNCGNHYRKGMLLQGFDFLLTGFSRKKEKELEMLIRKHGGIVPSDVPSPSPNLRGKRQSGHKHQQLPVVLSPKKVETTKFLYGCVIDTLLLKANWLSDSVMSGSVLSPDKYLILPNQASNGKRMKIGQPVRFNHHRIFDRVGIMLYGKPTFFFKLAKVVKHGGGQVFKTLHLLVQSLKNGRNSVGVIVVEEEGRASRHLKQCASEQKLPLMPASWIINSLHMGKLLSFKNNVRSALPRMISMPQFPPAMDFSEEI